MAYIKQEELSSDDVALTAPTHIAAIKEEEIGEDKVKPRPQIKLDMRRAKQELKGQKGGDPKEKKQMKRLKRLNIEEAERKRTLKQKRRQRADGSRLKKLKRKMERDGELTGRERDELMMLHARLIPPTLELQQQRLCSATNARDEMLPGEKADSSKAERLPAQEDAHRNAFEASMWDGPLRASHDAAATADDMQEQKHASRAEGKQEYLLKTQKETIEGNTDASTRDASIRRVQAIPAGPPVSDDPRRRAAAYDKRMSRFKKNLARREADIGDPKKSQILLERSARERDTIESIGRTCEEHAHNTYWRGAAQHGVSKRNDERIKTSAPLNIAQPVKMILGHSHLRGTSYLNIPSLLSERSDDEYTVLLEVEPTGALEPEIDAEPVFWSPLRIYCTLGCENCSIRLNEEDDIKMRVVQGLHQSAVEHGTSPSTMEIDKEVVDIQNRLLELEKEEKDDDRNDATEKVVIRSGWTAYGRF